MTIEKFKASEPIIRKLEFLDAKEVEINELKKQVNGDEKVGIYVQENGQSLSEASHIDFSLFGILDIALERIAFTRTALNTELEAIQQVNSFKDDKYLYGDYALEIEDIDENNIKTRIRALTKHLNDIQKVHYTKRDFSKLFDVSNAIDFWEDFLKKQNSKVEDEAN